MIPTRRSFAVVLGLVIMCLLPAVPQSGVAVAADWPQWRGPEFNGATTEKNLPGTFSKTEGTVWASPMPGPSGSTPVVWGAYVFVSSTDEATKTCVALA